MIDLSAQGVEALPVDHLGLHILGDLVAGDTWNEYNYLNSAKGTYGAAALDAIAEAFGWLHSRNLIARSPGDHSGSAIFVTRTGKRVVEDGPMAFFATEGLQGGIHPSIEKVARTQFLIGEYELGVFSAFKQVEVRLRELTGFSGDMTGVNLVRQAFSEKEPGPLIDEAPGTVRSEQGGLRDLFSGAFAVLRNPVAHRDVTYGSIAEAANAVHTASLLMHILDRIEKRLDHMQ